VPLYRASDRTLLILAVLLCFGVPRLLMVGTAQLLGQPFSMQLGSEAANEEYFKALKGSSLLPVFASNLTEGWRVKWMFQLGVFGRGYQTLGLFFLGLYLARQRWHESLPARRKTLRRAMLIGFGISVPLVTLFASFAFSQASGPPPDSVLGRGDRLDAVRHLQRGVDGRLRLRIPAFCICDRRRSAACGIWRPSFEPPSQPTSANPIGTFSITVTGSIAWPRLAPRPVSCSLSLSLLGNRLERDLAPLLPVRSYRVGVAIAHVLERSTVLDQQCFWSCRARPSYFFGNFGSDLISRI
jgi:hypothetical protein